MLVCVVVVVTQLACACVCVMRAALWAACPARALVSEAQRGACAACGTSVVCVVARAGCSVWVGRGCVWWIEW